MTTEQQAREALISLLATVRLEGRYLDRAEDARKTLIDFITQAAEDKRIADAVRGGERGYKYVDPFDSSHWAVFPAKESGTDMTYSELVLIPASVLEGA